MSEHRDPTERHERHSCGEDAGQLAHSPGGSHRTPDSHEVSGSDRASGSGGSGPRTISGAHGSSDSRTAPGAKSVPGSHRLPDPSAQNSSAVQRPGHQHDEHQRDEHRHGGHQHGGHGVSRRRLSAALAVTVVVLVLELVGASISGSLALAADAGHMAVDSTGLVVALIATVLMARPRDDRHTWGWERSEIIAAALQAGMLVIICLMVAWEAIQRLASPTPLDPLPMLAIGVIGLVANAVSLFILAGGRGDSLNMRAAFLEVANDALGSLAVIVAAILALTTGWHTGDAVASLFIAVLMAPRAVVLLRRSLRILMEETPEGLDLAMVRDHILSIPGVDDVHDLHVTTISTGNVSLTAHLTVAPEVDEPGSVLIVHALEDCVASHFPVPVTHSTVQIDSPQHRDHERLRH